MSAIELELQKATEINPRKKEGRQAYLRRLIDGVQELKDDQWEELSNDAQQWVNAGANAVKKDGDDATIDEFPDVESEEDEEEGENEKAAADDDDDGEAEDSKRKPAKSKDKPKAKDKPAKKAATDKPEKKSAGPKPTGIKVQIKKMVLKKPSISVDEIMERLSKDGTVKPSKLTISAIRSEFRHSLFVLRDANALSADIKLD